MQDLIPRLDRTPHRLASTRARGAVAALVVALLAGLFVSDARYGTAASTAGGLSVLPVLLAAWLLPGAPAAALTALAALLRLVSIAPGWVRPVTGLSQAVVVILVGYTAVRLVDALEERSGAAGLERDAAEQARAQVAEERAVRRREITLLEDVSRILASSLSEAEIEQHVARTAALILSHPGEHHWRSSFLIRDGDDLRVVAEHDDAGITLERHRYGLAESPMMRRVVERGELLHGDMSAFTGSPLGQAIATGSGLAAAAMAPVVVDGRVVGVLAMTSRRPHQLDEAQLESIRAIAHLAGLALTNAARFTEQRAVAERAQSLEEAKSRFLNLASHEMRGPLTVISGYLSMIADGDLGDVSPPVASVLPLVLGKVDEMERLVQQMLETARLEDGRLALSRRVLDARSIVDDAVTALTTVLSGHTLSVALGDAPALVDGDADRLTTVVTNLLDNACKYSHPGSPVTITVAGDEAQVAVAVTDQGVGVAERDRHLLFTRFGRIVTPQNSHIAGTGLGLWLSREIARMHGGDITVRSEPERGSTFTLVLPRAEVPAARRLTPSQDDVAAAERHSG